LYASLNCGRSIGDDARHVNENRRRALAAVDPRAVTLCTARQIHGSEVIAVETPWSADSAPQADGLVTNRPGVALGITTADCPCIAHHSYEVGPEVSEAFLRQNPDNQCFFEPDTSSDRHHFDLAGYVHSRLDKAGVRLTDIIGLDTCTDEERFFSYRRARQRSESTFGLGISVISLS
jgi:hypothetical protein